MKLITTALALAAIFSTKANSLELLSANALELSAGYERCGWDPSVYKWDPVTKQHTCVFRAGGRDEDETEVVGCGQVVHPSLTTELTINCTGDASEKYFSIRHIGTGKNGGAKGLNRLWKFMYYKECSAVGLVIDGWGALKVRNYSHVSYSSSLT